MKLFYFYTPNARKACAVAKHLKSDVEFVLTDLSKGAQRSKEFLAINPNGKVPALQDGAHNIWESSAIMAYLANKAESDLWPRDDERAIEVIRWLSWDSAHFSRHAGTLVFENYIKPEFGLGATDEGAVEEALGYFRQFAAVLDAHLKGRDYIVGKSLSIVDFAVAGFLPDAEAGKVPINEFPQIARWHGKLMELPAWHNPFPVVA